MFFPHDLHQIIPLKSFRAVFSSKVATSRGDVTIRRRSFRKQIIKTKKSVAKTAVKAANILVMVSQPDCFLACWKSWGLRFVLHKSMLPVTCGMYLCLWNIGIIFHFLRTVNHLSAWLVLLLLAALPGVENLQVDNHQAQSVSGQAPASRT